MRAMFTGIITGVGRIAAVHDLGSSSHHGKRLTIEAPAGYLDDVGLGDSIALNGACMTVTSLDAAAAAASPSTSRPNRWTRPPAWPSPAPVNLEKACARTTAWAATSSRAMSTASARVTHFAPVGESWELRILAPPRWRKYLAYKGSITVNGVSLTVNTRRTTSADGTRDQHQPDPAHGREHRARHAWRPAAASTSRST